MKRVARSERSSRYKKCSAEHRQKNSVVISVCHLSKQTNFPTFFAAKIWIKQTRITPEILRHVMRKLVKFMSGKSGCFICFERSTQSEFIWKFASGKNLFKKVAYDIDSTQCGDLHFYKIKIYIFIKCGVSLLLCKSWLLKCGEFSDESHNTWFAIFNDMQSSVAVWLTRM